MMRLAGEGGAGAFAYQLPFREYLTASYGRGANQSRDRKEAFTSEYETIFVKRRTYNQYAHRHRLAPTV